jgi:FAD/FMN-containing dehydrogenase
MDLDRRTLLRATAVGTMTALVPGCSAAGSGPTGPTAPRPVAARGGGPTRADWQALARSLDGAVVRRNNGGYVAAKQLFDPRFDRRSPLAIIEAASAGDVGEAIRFARRFDLAARPRAGGHSYVGASTVDDGLVIDVGRLDRTRFEAGSDHAIVGAGARLYDVHAALARHGRSIPTGTCPTVGAAGLTLGGGLGVDSRLHGLTSDRLVELTLVTADGVIRRADADHNSDLFWACRGAGGGNVGIVTSLRFATHRTHRFGFFLVSFPWSAAGRLLEGWSRRISLMPRSAWMNLRLEAGSDGSLRARVVGACPAGDEVQEAAAIERAVGVDATSTSTFRRSFLDGIEFLGGGTTSPRQAFAAGSDVISAMSPRLTRALPHLVARRAAEHHAVSVILDPLTGAVRDRGPGDTAFPWRRHLADIQWYIGLPFHPSRSAVSVAYDWIDGAHRVLGAASVGGYVNYLEPGRSVASYYGSNIARLRRIKRRHDPADFFHSSFTV